MKNQQTSRDTESTSLADWYERRSRADYPSYKRIEGYAKAIWRSKIGWENKVGVPEPEEFDRYLLSTLKTNLRNFDPDERDADKSVADRFLLYFGYWFEMRIINAKTRLSKPERNEALCARKYWLDRKERPPRCDRERTEFYWEYARVLFWEAMNDLDVIGKSYIKLRYIEGMAVKDIALKLKISERTLIRKYSSRYKVDNLVVIMRDMVREKRRKMPRQKLMKAVYTLLYENDFTLDEVARLFCMTRQEVARIQLETMEHIAEASARERRREG